MALRASVAMRTHLWTASAKRAYQISALAPLRSGSLCTTTLRSSDVTSSLRLLTRAAPRRHFTRYFIDKRLKKLEMAANEVRGCAEEACLFFLAQSSLALQNVSRACARPISRRRATPVCSTNSSGS